MIWFCTHFHRLGQKSSGLRKIVAGQEAWHIAGKLLINSQLLRVHTTHLQNRGRFRQIWSLVTYQSTLVKGKTHLKADLLWHALCLVGEHHGVTVAPALLTSMFPQLKLLKRTQHTQLTGYMSGVHKDDIKQAAFKTSFNLMEHERLTVANLLSISGPAFSTAVFWMKQQASSQLSWAMRLAASSIISLCWDVGACTTVSYTQL